MSNGIRIQDIQTKSVDEILKDYNSQLQLEQEQQFLQSPSLKKDLVSAYPDARSTIESMIKDGSYDLNLINQIAEKEQNQKDRSEIDKIWNTNPMVEKWKESTENQKKRVDDPEDEYDYVAAIRAKSLPTLQIDGTYKWPDKFKTDNNPERFQVKDNRLYDKDKKVLGFLDALQPGELFESIPFVGQIAVAKGMLDIYQSYKRLEDGEPTQQDLLKLKEFYDENNAKRTLGYNLAKGISQSVGFGLELAMTGGLYGAARKATTETVKKGLNKVLTKKTYQKVNDLLGASVVGRGTKFLTEKGIGLAGGTAAITPVVGTGRIGAEYIERILKDDETNQLLINIDKDDEEISTYNVYVNEGTPPEFGEAITKSVGSVFLENFSERTGALFGIAGANVQKLVKGKVGEIALFNSLKKLNPTIKLSRYKDIAKKVKFDGLVGEIGEERINDLLRAGLGIDDELRIPTTEEFLTEVGVILGTGGLYAGVANLPEGKVKKAKGTEIQSKLDQAKEEGLIDDVLYRQASYIASLDPNIDDNVAIEISNEIKPVTEELIKDTRGQSKEEFLKDEGFDPTTEAVVTGQTDVDQETGKTLIKLYTGADASTIVEEFYHDTYARLKNEEKVAFQQYHDAVEDTRSVEEHFAQEGTDYYFFDNMSENAYGGLRGVYNKLKNAFNKIVGKVDAIEGSEIPNQIQDIYKGAFQQRGEAAPGKSEFQIRGVITAEQAAKTGEPVLTESDVERSAQKRFIRFDGEPTYRVLQNIIGAPKRNKENLVEDYNVYKERIAETIKNQPEIAYWYFDYGKGAKAIVGIENMREFSIIFGITSAQKATDENFRDTMHVMTTARKIDPVKNPKEFIAAVKKLPNGKNIFLTGQQLNKIVEAYKTGTYEGGQKVTNYMISTEMASQNQFNPFTVNDVHMQRFFGFLEKVDGKTKGITTNNYRYIQYLTSRIAKELGISRQAAQAAGWAWARDNRGQPGQKTGTYEEALERTTQEGIIDSFNNTDKKPFESFKKGKSLAFAANRPFTSKVIENINKESPNILGSFVPGTGRGFKKTKAGLELAREFDVAVFDAITNDEGNIDFLDKANIPHKIERTLGSYGDLETSFVITLPQASIEQANLVAAYFGDAGLQDSIITYQNVFNENQVELGGTQIKKADGKDWSEKEIVDFHKTINPNQTEEGVNFYQHDAKTLRVITFEGMEDQVINALQKYTQSDKFETGFFGQKGEYLDAQIYSKRIRQTPRGQRQIATTRRSSLQRIAQDSLYGPIQKVYEEYKDRFQPEQTQQRVTQYQIKPIAGEPGRKGFTKKVGGISFTRDTFVAISTRLKEISESLHARLIKYDSDTAQKTLNRMKQVEPFLKGLVKLYKENRQDYVLLDLALKNSKRKDAQRIINKYPDIFPKNSFNKVKTVLTQINNEAKNQKIEMGFVHGYFPRKVLDHEGLMDYFERGNQREVYGLLEKELKLLEKKLKRPLTRIEAADILNARIKGYGNAIRKNATGQRTIQTVSLEMNEFYEKPEIAMSSYIQNMTQMIEQHKFFNRTKGKKLIDEVDSIGEFVSDGIANGEFNRQNQDELVHVLRARFANNGSSKTLVSNMRAVGYLTSMGNMTSAITQLGDLAWAIYFNPRGTIKSFAKAVRGKSFIRKQDLGIDQIAAEFQTVNGWYKAVDKVFKYTGLQWFDTVGKETLVNATLKKLQDQAKSGKFDAKTQRLFDEAFVNKTDAQRTQVIEDLKKGIINSDVKYVAFFQLSKFQPITMSEMPVNYVNNPNLRILYQLKTFTLKYFDLYRREAFSLISKGKRTGDDELMKEGFRNLMQLAFVFTIMNATSDAIKDLILGRPVKLEDRAIDSLLRLFGVHRFVAYKIRRDGLSRGLLSLVLPPFEYMDVPFKDIVTISKKIADKDEKVTIRDMKDLQSYKIIPFVGKQWYWWFGYGKKSQTKRTISEIRKLYRDNKLTPEDRKIYKDHVETAYENGWFDFAKKQRYLKYFSVSVGSKGRKFRKRKTRKRR